MHSHKAYLTLHSVYERETNQWDMARRLAHFTKT